MERHPPIKSRFEFEVTKPMSEVMAHTTTLHRPDAPRRVARFMCKHAALIERLPKKELASYLKLAPETLSPLERRHMGELAVAAQGPPVMELVAFVDSPGRVVPP